VPRKPTSSWRTEPRAPAASPVRTASVVPVAAPTFQASGWEAEVEELLARLVPSSESEATMARILRSIERTLAAAFPGARISGYASSGIQSGAAFAVAVPELEVVITMDPSTAAGSATEAQKWHKSVLRAVTDRLVARAAFKFRRSAFRNEAPAVTLLAPASGSSTEEATPLNLSINNAIPCRGTALVKECGHKDPTARALILLVRRWAKDRGLSHTAAGHLSPYAWTMLAIYFLQVGAPSGRLLPPVADFATYAKVNGVKGGGQPEITATPSTSAPAELLQAFFRFFAKEFNWQQEAVCPRSGCRASPSSELQQHIIAPGQEVAPSIEDPFDRTKNLGSCLTHQSLARLREEFLRADSICTDTPSLASLLEPWAPPEAAKGEQE